MDKREKVIKGLECCVQDVVACYKCPYDPRNTKDVGNCGTRLTNDALELLKAQEARVMTLVELWHMEHKPVYLERKSSRLYITEPSIVLKTERCYFPFLGDSYILMRENKIHDKYWACDYNKTWRCWTSRPTDEQTEATPWAK